MRCARRRARQGNASTVQQPVTAISSTSQQSQQSVANMNSNRRSATQASALQPTASEFNPVSYSNGTVQGNALATSYIIIYHPNCIYSCACYSSGGHVSTACFTCGH